MKTTLITIGDKDYCVKFFPAFTRVDGTQQKEFVEIVREYRVRIAVDSARQRFSYRSVKVSPFSALGMKILSKVSSVRERLCTPVTISQAVEMMV